jgi:hypothetical protein
MMPDAIILAVTRVRESVAQDDRNFYKRPKQKQEQPQVLRLPSVAQDDSRYSAVNY